MKNTLVRFVLVKPREGVTGPWDIDVEFRYPIGDSRKHLPGFLHEDFPPVRRLWEEPIGEAG